SARSGGPHRLVEPLAPEEHVEAGADHGLARRRPSRRADREVHHEAAEHAHAVAGGAHGVAPRSRAPRAPPGWCWWKSSGPKSRATMRAMASASPTTAVTAVEVEGTRSHGSASVSTPMSMV